MTGKAHQRIIRERMAACDPVPPLDLDMRRAHVRPISYQQAKPVILKYEWLGRMAPTKYHYGLFFDPVWDTDCAGVVCIGGQNCTGASYTHKMLCVEQHQLGVFARGACVHWAPPHAGSFLIGRALRQLKQHSPYKVVIAYADPDAGEIGTLYQATNWDYIGLTQGSSFRLKAPDRDYSFDSASIIVQAQKRGLRWKEVYEEYLANGWTRIPKSRKHRYVYVLDKRCAPLVEKIAAMRLPYPKREAA